MVNQAQSGLSIGLIGEPGSGKTTWASAFIAFLTGQKGSSPSYELVHSYHLAWGKLYHIDCYRLSDGNALASLGLEDLDLPTTLLLVEWPGNSATALPAFDVQIFLSFGDTSTLVQQQDMVATTTKKKNQSATKKSPMRQRIDSTHTTKDTAQSTRRQPYSETEQLVTVPLTRDMQIQAASGRALALLAAMHAREQDDNFGETI